jgi:hypothetical protein
MFGRLFTLPRSRRTRKQRLPDKRPSAGSFAETLESRFLLATIFSDGFEGAFPGSWFVGNNNSNTVAQWGDNSYRAATGSWSAFCADNGSNTRNTYDNNLNTYMQRRNINLSGYTSATLTFKYWLKTEASFDRFEVNVRSQSGVWSNVLTDSGDDSALGWQTRTINLNSYAGQSNIYISFDFISDGSVVPAAPAGVWVDDVVLDATAVQAGIRVSNANPSSWSGTSPISGSMTVQMWNGENPNAVCKAVVGIRDSAGNWVGGQPQVIVTDIPPVGSPGTTYSNRSFSSLAVPSTPGTYTLWIFEAQAVTDADAIQAFKNQRPTSQDEMNRIVGPVTVPNQSDLALTNLVVSPSTVTSKAFTACSFTIVNNGPTALSSENLFVEYFLSDDTTFGDADDYKIGDTGFTGVSISSGGSYAITLSQTGLNNMVAQWPSGKPDDLNLYVFARVSIPDGSPSDPVSSNNHARTSSPIFVNVVPLGGSQIVNSTSGVVIEGAAGSSVSVPVTYTTSDNDNTLTGLGLRMHFNSSMLTFTGLSGILQTGLIAQQPSVPDTSDYDNDPATTHYVLVSWADLQGNWPNTTLPATLYSAGFTLAPGLANGTTANIKFSASSTATGYGFTPNPIAVRWGMSLNYDIDGNRAYDALTDGLLIMRYLFGFTNGPLIANAIGSGAARTTANEITAYLDQLRSASALDVDGNGVKDALTDGLLIMRYMFGFTNGPLIANAIGAGATRTTADQVIAYMQQYIPSAQPMSLEIPLMASMPPNEVDSAAPILSEGGRLAAAALGAPASPSILFSTDPIPPLWGEDESILN